MNFFQRIGNALSRFMYGRNGVDRLCLTMIWTALLLDVINLFLRDRQSVVYSILAFVSTVIMFWRCTVCFPQSGEAAERERTLHGEGLESRQPPHRRKPAAADGQGAPLFHLPPVRRGVPRAERQGAHRHHLPPVRR